MGRSPWRRPAALGPPTAPCRRRPAVTRSPRPCTRRWRPPLRRVTGPSSPCCTCAPRRARAACAGTPVAAAATATRRSGRGAVAWCGERRRSAREDATAGRRRSGRAGACCRVCTPNAATPARWRGRAPPSRRRAHPSRRRARRSRAAAPTARAGAGLYPGAERGTLTRPRSCWPRRCRRSTCAAAAILGTDGDDVLSGTALPRPHLRELAGNGHHRRRRGRRTRIEDGRPATTRSRRAGWLTTGSSCRR